MCTPKDNWQPAYIGKKTTKRHAFKKPGLYFIKVDDKLVYIGMSRKNIYHALYRHFEKWDDHPARVIFPFRDNLQVRVLITHAAEAYERRLIKLFKPKLNKFLYDDFEFVNDFIPQYENINPPF